MQYLSSTLWWCKVYVSCFTWRLEVCHSPVGGCDELVAYIFQAYPGKAEFSCVFLSAEQTSGTERKVPSREGK